jgi:hypothetical protein
MSGGELVTKQPRKMKKKKKKKKTRNREREFALKKI